MLGDIEVRAKGGGRSSRISFVYKETRKLFEGKISAYLWAREGTDKFERILKKI